MMSAYLRPPTGVVRCSDLVPAWALVVSTCSVPPPYVYVSQSGVRSVVPAGYFSKSSHSIPPNGHPIAAEPSRGGPPLSPRPPSDSAPPNPSFPPPPPLPLPL